MIVYFFLAIQIVLLAVVTDGAVAPATSVLMKIYNHAGAPLEVFWIDTYKNDGTVVRQTTKPLRNNTETSINSYNGHQFVARFLNHIDGVEAKFTKGPREERIIVTYDELTGEMNAKVTSKFDEIKEAVSASAKLCSNLKGEKYSECIADQIAEDVNRISDSKILMQKFRDLTADRLRNYTCADEALQSSTPIGTVHQNVQGQLYRIDELMDTSHAKIWTVDNFIKDEECELLEKHGKPRLRRATVAAEDGSSIISENRKANQAGYDFRGKHEEDPLWPLFTRILELTNRYTGYNIQPPGQESFTIIQYNQADEYSPHCDGTCDGSMHIPTGRVATAVMYCKVPTRGGATTFTKADLFVRPKKGMATFFSYKGPDGRMEDGLTEHSGCPVIEGEKWITTLWMREGVDYEHTWEMYDPSGVLIAST